MNGSLIRGAVLQGMGSLGWNEIPTGASAWTDTYGFVHGQLMNPCSAPTGRFVCAVPGGSSEEDAWIAAHGCVSRNVSCQTRAGSSGREYCCRGYAAETPGVTPTTPNGKTGSGGGGTWLDPIDIIPSPGGVLGPGVTEAGSSMRCRTESPRSGGSSYWRQVQQTLCDRGFDPGQIDGRVGTNTRNGVRAFQQAAGIGTSGQVDSATASALGVTAESGAGAGTTTGRSPTTTQDAPVQPVQAGAISRFFDVRNPTMWLALAGVLLVGGGVTYGVTQYRKQQRKALPAPGTMGQLGTGDVDDELASMKARLATQGA